MRKDWPVNNQNSPELALAERMSHLGCKGLGDACDLRSNCSSECHQIAVAPIVPRFRRCASERPQPDAFVIDAKRSAKLRIIPSGSDRNFAEQLNRCWAAS